MPQVTDYVSILAGNFLQPLATILEKLYTRERQGIPGVMANQFETDWSVSAILLAVVMLESWIGRVRLDMGPNGPKQIRALAFYDELRAAHANLPDIAEIFVIRDVIAHNHIWKVEFQWDEETSQLTNLDHEQGGDRKFRRVADLTSGITSVHQLHLVPTLIDRSDVAKVLNIVVEAMQALIDIRLLMPQALRHNAVWRNGRRLTLPELADIAANP